MWYHAKLPNLVIVAVLGFIYFLAFRPLKEDSVMKLNVNGSIKVDDYSRKPSFTLKIVQNPFLRRPDGYDGRRFQRRGGKKKTNFFFNLGVHVFVFGR